MPGYNNILVNRWGLPEDASTVTVYLSLTGDGRVQGRLFNPYIELPLAFEGLGDMFLYMELVYDYLDYPYSPNPPAKFVRRQDSEPRKTEKRPSFRRYREPGTGGPPSYRSSFEIKVRTRNAESWQGSVVWKEKNLRRSFTSALQLLHLISDALGLPRLQ